MITLCARLMALFGLSVQPPSREDVIKAIELKFSDIMSISAKESSNPSFSGKGMSFIKQLISCVGVCMILKRTLCGRPT